jgi:ribosomal protein S6
MPIEYEITYVADAQLTDDARAELDTAVDALISEKGGSVIHSTANIRRRLFYPIQKKSNAFARVANLELEPEHIEEVRRVVRRMPGVLRLTILRTPARTEITPDAFKRTGAGQLELKGKKDEKPAKEVTMKDVEEGIESALQEEVK